MAPMRRWLVGGTLAVVFGSLLVCGVLVVALAARERRLEKFTRQRDREQRAMQVGGLWGRGCWLGRG